MLNIDWMNGNKEINIVLNKTYWVLHSFVTHFTIMGDNTFKASIRRRLLAGRLRGDYIVLYYPFKNEYDTLNFLVEFANKKQEAKRNDERFEQDTI